MSRTSMPTGESKMHLILDNRCYRVILTQSLGMFNIRVVGELEEDTF